MSSTQGRESATDASEWYGAISDCINQAYRNFQWPTNVTYYRNNTIPTEARNIYLLRIIRELEKANYLFNPIFDFIKKTETRFNAETMSVLQCRRYDAWFQAYMDTLNLWNRKITEVIVHLAGFQTSDEESYYQHYLELDLLRDKNAFIDDMQTYHGISSKILAKGADQIKTNIDEILKRADLLKCWYIQKGKPYKMASFKDKFTFALAQMDQSTKNVMAVYTMSFATPSKSLHLETSLQPRSNLTLEDVKELLTKTWFLVFFALDNIQGFLRTKIQNEALDQFKNVIGSNPIMKKLWEEVHRSAIKEGDLVHTGHFVGRVTKVKTSDLGYRSFQVQFLFPNLDPTMKEDWFAAPSLDLLPSKAAAVKHIKSIAASVQYAVTDTHIAECLKEEKT